MSHDVLGEDSNFQVVGNLYGTHAVRPAAGTVLDGILYVETDTGTVVQAQSGAWVVVDTLTTADVVSVFGRTNVVSAQTGDYSVAQVTGAASITSLTTETTRATTAEGANAAAITAETSRAGAAEATLTSGLAAEVSRAGTAEGVNAAAITAETSRAETAEAAAQTAAEAYTDTTVANATANVVWFTHAGDPNTAVTALGIGNLCVDVTNGALYISTAADNSHWVAL